MKLIPLATCHLPLATCLVIASNAFAVERTVSDIHILLENWELVPTLKGTQVESFLCIQDEASVVGSNITSIWFLRVSDSDWSAFAWNEPDVIKPIAHVKNALQLADSTDIFWPNAEAQQGVNPLLAVEPEVFGTGVFQEDPFSEIIELMDDPGLFIELLTNAGWIAADIELQTGISDCTQNELLSTLAALVEADIYMDAGGAHVAQFSIPDMICKEWMSVSSALDSDGKWVTYDLSAYLEVIASIDPSLAWQNIPAGAVFEGSQTIIIDAGSRVGIEQPLVTNHLVVTLQDITPPTISLDNSSISSSSLSPTGLVQFVAPIAVTPVFSVFDAVDTNPIIEIRYDNQVVLPGSSISALGLHNVSVNAVDESGNESESVFIFEIRDKPEYTATVVVEEFQVTPTESGETLISAVILLAASDFDIKEINLPSVSLWLANDDGSWANEIRIPIEGAYINGEYNFATAKALYENCNWRLSFSVELNVDLDSIVGLDLIGKGLVGELGEFDFRAISNTSIDSTPQQTLVNLGISCEAAQMNPGPQIEPSCEWQYRFDPPKTKTKSCGTDPLPCGWFGLVEASVFGINGTSLAEDSFFFCGAGEEFGGVCDEYNNGVIHVFALPAGCCSQCAISIYGVVGFPAYALANPPARAGVSGHISAIQGAFSMQAIGGVAIGDWGTETVVINGVPIPVYDDVPPTGNLIQDEDSKVIPDCFADIVLHTGIGVSVYANANWANWRASAHARIWDSYMVLEVNPHCLSGEAPDLPTPFKYEH